MRNILILFSICISSFAIGQTADSVATANGAQEVFYSLETGTQTPIITGEWHLGFTLSRMDASIMINESNEVEAFAYTGTDWNTVDTTGMTWTSLKNSETSWSNGALANQGTVHPNYGWGMYDQNTHDINGTQILIINYGSFYKQLLVKAKTASGLFIIDLGDIGGGNTRTDTMSSADFADQNFAYYNIDNGIFTSLEPKTDEWELLFTKYLTPIPTGPGTFQDYLVAGIKTNKGWETAQRDGVDPSSNDTAGLSWSEDITEIGYDWKTFNNSTFQYDITQNRTYFLREKEGAKVYKIWFDGYSGGQHNFNSQIIAGSAGVEIPQINVVMFPNPANNIVELSNPFASESKVQIIGTDGSLVDSFVLSGNSTSKRNVTSWSKGMYIIQIASDTGITSTRLLVQ